jgi:hypothetical protein
MIAAAIESQLICSISREALANQWLQGQIKELFSFDRSMLPLYSETIGSAEDRF